MSKGSTRRPNKIGEKEVRRKWDDIFKKPKDKPKKWQSKCGDY